MERDETLEALEAVGTEQNRKVYGRHGVIAPMYGVSYKDLAALQKRIEVDEPLAEELWASGNHDARILATRIADPDVIEAPVVDSWASDLDNYVLAGAFAGLVGRTPFAVTRMRRWIERAGWLILAGLALRDTESDDASYAAYLPRIEQDILSAKNRVRDAMNAALISIGTRSDDLEAETLEIAARIGPVDVDHGATGCKTPTASTYIPKARARQRKKEAKARV